MWEGEPVFFTRSCGFMEKWLIFILDPLGAKIFRSFVQSDKGSCFNSTKTYLCLADSVDTDICDREKVSLILQSRGKGGGYEDTSSPHSCGEDGVSALLL